MAVKVAKWGNSLAVRLPHDVARKARLEDQAEVEFEVKDGNIIISASHKKDRYKKRLDEILATIPDDYRPEVIDWGPPVGREVW